MKKVQIILKSGRALEYEADRYVSDGVSVFLIRGDGIFATFNFTEIVSVEYVEQLESEQIPRSMTNNGPAPAGRKPMSSPAPPPKR